jgi:hypothetical protein
LGSGRPALLIDGGLTPFDLNGLGACIVVDANWTSLGIRAGVGANKHKLY